jgi:hypothetical protein
MEYSCSTGAWGEPWTSVSSSGFTSTATALGGGHGHVMTLAASMHDVDVIFPENGVPPESVKVPVLGKTGVLPELQVGNAFGKLVTFSALKDITTEIPLVTHFDLSTKESVGDVVMLKGSLVAPLPLHIAVPTW